MSDDNNPITNHLGLLVRLDRNARRVNVYSEDGDPCDHHFDSEDCEAIGNAFIDLGKRLNGWKRASELAKHLMGQNE